MGSPEKPMSDLGQQAYKVRDCLLVPFKFLNIKLDSKSVCNVHI